MNECQLDKKLRELNKMELELQELLQNYSEKVYKDKLKEVFSQNNKNEQWVINVDKLMKESEMITIHKHDRFIKFDKHKHDYLEMIFVYSGTITHVIENSKVEINKGEIVILDMNVEHSIEIASENDIAVNILIKQEFFDWIFMSQISYNDIISDFIVKALYEKKQFKQYLHFKTSENLKIWTIMMKILGEYYEPQIGMETSIRAYIMLLFNELLRDYKQHLSSQFVKKVDKSINIEIMDYITKHYKEANIKDMAAYFNFNSDYMGKLIKQMTGKSFKTLVREQKLEQAKYLLKSTNMSVTNIINEVGYSNATYFYRQFKTHFEVTPDELRHL